MNENEQIVLPPLSHDEAQEVTNKIYETTELLFQLLLKAYEGQAHKALGYSSWEAYVTTEFDMTKRRSYQLIDHGRVIRTITTTINEAKDYLDNQGEPGFTDEIPIIEINERDTRGMKPHIEEIKTELQTAIESGITPQEAVVALVDKYGAPSSNEAEELAKITGLSIAGDDNEYHSGKSAEELKESKLLTEQWMAVVNAGESIKKLPSPRRFVSSVPLFMRRSIKTNIPDSIIWLNGVQKIIDVEWKE